MDASRLDEEFPQLDLAVPAWLPAVPAGLGRGLSLRWSSWFRLAGPGWSFQRRGRSGCRPGRVRRRSGQVSGRWPARI